jgi:hypothetical protein
MRVRYSSPIANRMALKGVRFESDAVRC